MCNQILTQLGGGGQGSSREGDSDQQRQQYDFPGPGGGMADGPGGDQGFATDEGDTALEVAGGGEPRILITCPSNKAVFGTLATQIISDLCAVGTQQACRVVPRRWG